MVNRISVRSLLAIEIINEFPSISIEYVLYFNQVHLDMDVFMEIPLGMGVDGKRRKWFLKLNKSLYGIKQQNSDGSA